MVQVHVGRRGESRATNVHLARLVALAWVGPCPPGCAVAHKDSDQSNLDADNLCWKTRREHRLHTIPRGSAHHKAKLTESRVVAVRLEVHAAVREGREPDWEVIARREGVCVPSLKRVAAGKSWPHVDAGVPLWAYPPRRALATGGRRKLTVEDARRIKARLARGETPRQIHPEYAHLCCLQNIREIAKGKSWNRV